MPDAVLLGFALCIARQVPGHLWIRGKESCRALTEGGRTDPYAHKGENAPEFIPEVGYSRSNNSVFIV